MKNKNYLVTVSLLLCLTIVSAQSSITETELRAHIQFLTSDTNAGRYPGGKLNKKVVKYIQKNFKKSKILPFSKSYTQEFVVKLRVKKEMSEQPDVKTWNVIGVIEGSDPILKEEYIVLGAHYDHLGLGGGPSSKSEKIEIHYGADDNASGTAALLEIGEKLAANKSKLKRSILLIAFGGEEQGLKGSSYFVENPIVPLSQIKLMINMDMVGRLNEANQVYMGGAGTFPDGQKLMKELGPSLGLSPVVHAGSVGGSDHVSFYRKKISVMGLHTGGHPQYHTPEDTIDLINFPGQKKVCDYIYTAILKLAGTNYSMEFIPQD